uniref:Uncharacterized protein n=1 Tax=Candidatus Kentrum sp. LPFa TaxID=2126335 RepID=A0A450WTB0_9GAMM|nr:MAG: hypothetical protein BECKLPF1236A_GA0070988_102548 [Candidatus Kentron sp. LPFa]VFK34291.1 MAG: hypothetical protein BECKLPF1236C_GA0070990_102578 [Candidatus Kentron sp. LPFa]
MNTAKEEVNSLLGKLPEDCALEDIQYHLYVAGKIRQGQYRAQTEGTLSQEDMETRFSKWTLQ